MGRAILFVNQVNRGKFVKLSVSNHGMDSGDILNGLARLI